MTEGEAWTRHVRVADRGDEEAIFRLLTRLHRHNGNGWGYPYDPRILWMRIQRCTRPIKEERDNPEDGFAGVIGVIDNPNGAEPKIVGAVGLFGEPAMWWTTYLATTELFLYIDPEFRHPDREKALREFSKCVHETLKAKNRPDYPCPFNLHTGFIWPAEEKRFELMRQHWLRRWGGRLMGCLFVVD